MTGIEKDLVFKDEDEVDGIAVGPAYIRDAEGEIVHEYGWVAKTTALHLAEEFGLRFVEA
jgi:hypothetical protein